MPLVIGWNIRPSADAGDWRLALTAALVAAAASVPELGISPDHVKVSLPLEPLVDLDKPAVLTIELLHDRPERTFEARTKLGEALRDAFKGVFPERPVEVAVKKFNPDKDPLITG